MAVSDKKQIDSVKDGNDLAGCGALQIPRLPFLSAIHCKLIAGLAIHPLLAFYSRTKQEGNFLMKNYGYVSAMKKYTQFSGRAPRKEYWMFTLLSIIISIIATVVDAMVFGVGVESIGIFGTISALVHFIPGLSAAVRRLHDTGRSGWWLLIILIPLIGVFILLYWLIKGPDSGANYYGANPYGAADPQVS